MKTSAVIPAEFLSSWYFSVRWSRTMLEAENNRFKERGWDTTYNDRVLGDLLDIENFLQVSWDSYMESITHTPVEVLTDA